MAIAKKTDVPPRPRRAGLAFPVSRIARYMKQGKFSPRIGGTAPIYLTAVLEHMVAEVMDLAGKVALTEGKTRITPRHIQLGMRNDAEFIQLLGKVTIGSAGVMPNLNALQE